MSYCELKSKLQNLKSCWSVLEVGSEIRIYGAPLPGRLIRLQHSIAFLCIILRSTPVLQYRSTVCIPLPYIVLEYSSIQYSIRYTGNRWRPFRLTSRPYVPRQPKQFCGKHRPQAFLSHSITHKLASIDHLKLLHHLALLKALED